MVHKSNFKVDHNRPPKSCFLELKEILPGRLESNRHIVMIAIGYYPFADFSNVVLWDGLGDVSDYPFLSSSNSL